MADPQRTCFEELDCLSPLILLSNLILLDHVVLDLLVTLSQRFQLHQNSLCEVRDAWGGGWLGVWQVDINHEDVREHTGRNQIGQDETRRKG